MDDLGQPHPPVERPPRGRLNRATVLEAARRQVDEAGLGSLSSRAIAGRLGVTPMAIYRHVADMDDVVGEVVDQFLDELGTPARTPDWRGWLEESAESLRALLRDEPEILALYTRRPITTPAARRRLAEATVVLEAAGFSPTGAAQAFAAVHTYTIGYSALAEGRRRTPAPSGDLDAPEDATSAAIRGFVSEAQFQFGLRTLVAGLRPDRSS